MVSGNDLEMTFDIKTISHLGLGLYSHLAPALGELIANSYDANATEVIITLIDGDHKKIIIEDDGEGMTFDEINNEYLIIARNRREADSGKRKPIGKKGLGKLAFFGMANKATVNTKKEGKENTFVLDGTEMSKVKPKENYRPEIKIKNGECAKGSHGTTITLTEVKRKGSFDIEALATSISRIFVVYRGFQIILKQDDKEIRITNELRYQGIDIEFKWSLPKDIEAIASGDNDLIKYIQDKKITGQLVTSKKPLKSSDLLGINLVSRTKMVNKPEFFSGSESSHIYSYLSGVLEIDFIDDMPEDVIATSRQSLNWDSDNSSVDLKTLRDNLKKIIRYVEKSWRKKRTEKKDKEIKDATGSSTTDWLKAIDNDPSDPVREGVEALINILDDSNDVDIPSAERIKIEQQLKNKIAPPKYKYVHRYFMWENFHSLMKESPIIEKNYNEDNYHTCIEEAFKILEIKVREKLSKKDTGASLMNHLSLNNNNLSPKKYYINKGILKEKDISDDSETSIRESLFCGSKASAFERNIVAHMTRDNLDKEGKGPLTSHDCLNVLSWIYHMLKRLEHTKIDKKT